VVLIKVLTQTLPGEAEENHERLSQGGTSVLRHSQSVLPSEYKTKFHTQQVKSYFLPTYLYAFFARSM